MTRIKLARIITLVLLVLFAGYGCATITRGTFEEFAVESEPPGAEATLSTGTRCTTPCSFVVRRREPIELTISKDGYKSVQTTVEPSFDEDSIAAMAGNVFSGGLVVGVGVDAHTGALLTHKPNPIVVKLEKVPDGD